MRAGDPLPPETRIWHFSWRDVAALAVLALIVVAALAFAGRCSPAPPPPVPVTPIATTAVLVTETPTSTPTTLATPQPTATPASEPSVMPLPKMPDAGLGGLLNCSTQEWLANECSAPVSPLGATPKPKPNHITWECLPPP